MTQLVFVIGDLTAAAGVTICQWSVVNAVTLTPSRRVVHKPFIGLWQPRKAGLNKHTGKSCIHKLHNIRKITSLEMI